MMVPLRWTAITRRIFHPHKDGAQVHREHRIELLQINVGDGGILRTSPGVVREATEAIRCMVDHRLDVGFDRDICTDEARLRASFSPLSWRRPTLTTLAPLATKTSVVQAPTPLVLPVIIATFPSSGNMAIDSSC